MSCNIYTPGIYIYSGSRGVGGGGGHTQRSSRTISDCVLRRDSWWSLEEPSVVAGD